MKVPRQYSPPRVWPMMSSTIRVSWSGRVQRERTNVSPDPSGSVRIAFVSTVTVSPFANCIRKSSTYRCRVMALPPAFCVP